MEKTVVELVDELVEAQRQLEKIKYPLTADRRIGFVQASYAMAYAFDLGYSIDAVKSRLENAISEIMQEVSDLSDKVEA